MSELRKYVEAVRASLVRERNGFEKPWSDVARFAAPSRSRWLVNGSRNVTARRLSNDRLLDSHGVLAMRVLANGMTSGLCSASRPWAILKFDDENFKQDAAANTWLSDTSDRIFAFLAKTNFYGAVRGGFSELGLFGTEACVMEEHPTEGMVFHLLTAGEYWIGLNSALVADVLMRRMTMTMKQLAQTFGKTAHPDAVKEMKEGNTEREVEVWHLIEPNKDHVEGDLFSHAYRSIYWCPELRDDKSIMRKSGYHEKPFWAPRWDVLGGDVYGTSPAMDARADLRELQMQAKRRNEATDKLVKPELVVKAGVNITGQAGNVVSVSAINEHLVQPVNPMQYQTIVAIEQLADAKRRAIDSLTYADLFNAITNMQGIQPRNMEEIASRNEEKLTQLGPVIERVGNEKLRVAIDRVFGVMMRGGLLAPPPQSLAEAATTIEIEFVSILAQMQRLVGVGQIERTVSFIGNLAGVVPSVLDKMDTDAMVDEYADRTGLPPHLIRTTKDAQAIRDQRAQAEQQAQMTQMAPAVKQGAEAARLLSETDVGGGNLLDQVLMGAA